MTRVRGFTQDDAHLFCTDEQVADEFRGCIELTQFVLDTLGLNDYRVRLGFRDPDQRQVRRQRRELGPGRSSRSTTSCKSLRHELHRRAGRSGVLRAEDRLRGHATASAANGSSAPCSSTTTCPSGSTWNTSAPTTTRTAR